MPPRKYPQDIALPPLEYAPLDDDDGARDTEGPPDKPKPRKDSGRLVWHERTWFEIVKDPVELEYEDME